MSTPPSEAEDLESTSSLLMTETIDADAEANAEITVDVGTHILMEKQLLMARTRVGQLTNDNQRLLSQNISLCQAIKQQKAEMGRSAARNAKLEAQMAKLFVTVRTLSRSNQQKSDAEQELSRSLHSEFQNLKDALAQKDAHIAHLQTAERQITATALKAKNDNERFVAERAEYERTIATHCQSIEDFNDTIVALQKAMDAKDSALNDAERDKATLSKLIEVNAESLQEKQRKLSDALTDVDAKSRESAQKSQHIAELTTKLEEFPAQIRRMEETNIDGAQQLKELRAEMEWWKAEAAKLDSECKLSVARLRDAKNELNSAELNRFEQSNVDSWRARFYALCWRRFAEFASFTERMAQTREVVSMLRKQKIAQQKQPLTESFKMSMLRSLKDVEDVDIDRLLLCADIKELAQYLRSSQMSTQLQMQIAAQLLPVVESHRIKLQRDIGTKIDRILKKRKARSAMKKAQSVNVA